MPCTLSMKLFFSIEDFWRSCKDWFSSVFLRTTRCFKIVLFLANFSSNSNSSPCFLRGSVPPWWVLVFRCGSATLWLALVIGSPALDLYIRGQSARALPEFPWERHGRSAGPTGSRRSFLPFSAMAGEWLSGLGF